MGKYSYQDEYPLDYVRASIRRTNTYRYPLKNTGQAVVRGRVIRRFWNVGRTHTSTYSEYVSIFYEVQLQIVMQQRTPCTRTWTIIIQRHHVSLSTQLHSAGNNIWNKRKSATQRPFFFFCFFFHFPAQLVGGFTLSDLPAYCMLKLPKIFQEKYMILSSRGRFFRFSFRVWKKKSIPGT